MVKKKNGFTLMEMLAVIFIMAVIAGIMLPALRRVREGGRVTHARNEINQLIAAIQMYAEDWGDYPIDDGSAGSWGDAHSQDLKTSKSLIDALKKVDPDTGDVIVEESYSLWPEIVIDDDGNLVDPWGNPYRYRYDDTVAGRAAGVAFNLYSAGPDRTYGTEDDIINW